MTEQRRLPTKPLNPIARAAASSAFPTVIAVNAGLAVAAVLVFGLDAVTNTGSWTMNVVFLLLSGALGCTAATLALLRARLSVRVGFTAGILGALKKVDPGLVYKALPLYDAGLKIMVSEYICGGNEVMRDKVAERVKKIRELSTAHEASRIHELGDHDLLHASTLIENFSRPAIEARENAQEAAAAAKLAAMKEKEDAAASRYQARKELERSATAVEPDKIIPKHHHISLKNQDEEPTVKGKEKVK